MGHAQIKNEYRVTIIGCGLSGIAAAVKLKKEGITDFVILEKSDQVGGTWRENTYPGCGCDVPSSLYSFSFALNNEWDYSYARQPQILKYIEDTVNKMQLRPFLQTCTELQEAEWVENKRRWKITTNRGAHWSQFVIFAAGPITEPSIPNLPGLDSFEGETFHSARWNHDYELKGKRVAVIGSGASAIQFVPEIYPDIESMVIFQRTAPWVFPRPNRKISSYEKSLMERFSFLQKTERQLIQQGLLLINYGLLHPWVMRRIEPYARNLLKKQVRDPELLKKVSPDFTIGCKRVLFSNDWYRTLQKPKVELLADSLASVQGNQLISKGGERRTVDTIIFGTGFDVTHPPIAKRIRCADGKFLADHWSTGGPEAYMGTTFKDAPNAFFMVGPNILVYSSFIGIAEWQSIYVVDAIKKAGNRQIEVIRLPEDFSRQYNQKVQKLLQSTVWNDGNCISYYLDDHGKNFAAWPWKVPELKRRLSRFDFEHYELTLFNTTPKKLKFAIT